MSLSSLSSPGTAPAAAAAPSVPDATRHRRPGWRDPRLLLGLLILCGSVVLGARIFSAADDTVAVWAADADLAEGAALTSDDVRRVRIRFTDAGDADHYLSADRDLPAGSVLGRAVAAGELLPRAALGVREELVEVPVSVEVDRVPVTVRQGSHVDVWVAPTASQAGKHAVAAERVLQDVVVVAAPPAADTLAPSGTRQIIVGVDPATAGDLGDALGQLANGRVMLTGRN